MLPFYNTIVCKNLIKIFSFSLPKLRKMKPELNKQSAIKQILKCIKQDKITRLQMIMLNFTYHKHLGLLFNPIGVFKCISIAQK